MVDDESDDKSLYVNMSIMFAHQIKRCLIRTYIHL